MDEFRRLPWPLYDYNTNFQDEYNLNIVEYQKVKPTDVFLCNLLEIDAHHFNHINQRTDQTERQTVSCEFIDPRTGVEIPSHECNHKNIDLETRNIFLTNRIEVSILSKSEHVACLNVLRRAASVSNQKTNDDDDEVYESSEVSRFQEKNLFLNKLKELFDKLSKRYHDVPPSINHFITQKWKKQLILMHRELAGVRYVMSTAISLQPIECAVKANLIHQEHLGNVPEMTNKSVDYLRQSFLNLMQAYNRRKMVKMQQKVKATVKELVEGHAIDFVIPISVIKLIVSGEEDWAFQMTVRESQSSTPFNSKKEIIFDKPLPPTHLNGRERYRKGAKYLIRSCLNQHSQNVFSHKDCTEVETGIDKNSVPLDIQAQMIAENDDKYQVVDSEEFIKNHSKCECSYENMTFAVMDIVGSVGDGDGDGSETETFRILVPSKQDAYTKNASDQITFVNYAPKIEYQAEYGAEVMTTRELIDEWCDLFFRPNSYTERVRFDCVSGKIVHRESKTRTAIECELEVQSGIEPRQLLGRLWHALETFSAFPVGDYLLYMDKKQSNYTKVYKRIEKWYTSLVQFYDEGVDILQIIKNVSFDLNVFEKAEWQAICDRTITDIHRKFQILPCAFPHIEYLREHNIHKRPTQKCKQAIETRKEQKVLQICPRDDSRKIALKRVKVQEKKAERKKQRTLKYKQAKNRRKSLKRAEKQQIKKANNLEIQNFNKELDETKNILLATMDQYSSVSGQKLAESASISTRTRRQSKSMNSPEKANTSTICTRRSSRATANK